MLRSAVEDRLRAAYERDGLVYPAYGSYCFANVPDTVQSLLDAGGRRPLPGDVFEGVDTAVERVVLVLLDGYGLDAWKRDRTDHDLLAALTERGTVTPLTSTYPSETAAAITTLETATLPCEHGRIGWNVYDPATDRSFLGLSGEIKADGTVGEGPEATDDEGTRIAPEAAEGIEPLGATMAAAGVDHHRLQPFNTDAEGLTQHTYDGLDAFGGRLAAITEAADVPAYVYGYVPDVDHVSHEHGTDSEAFQATVAAACEQLRAFLDALDPGVARGTLLLVAADHGHVDTVPAENVDLSANDAVVANLRRYGDGTPVKLSGSPRNVHLHLQEGTVEETRAALSQLDAQLLTREELLDRELFGDREPSRRFERRCGDLVVTHRNRGVWFGDVEPGELSLIGMHGGLHPSEMLVPFAAVRADRLQ